MDRMEIMKASYNDKKIIFNLKLKNHKTEKYQIKQQKIYIGPIFGTII